MSFNIIKGDIFKLSYDAIVITTSPEFNIKEGVLGRTAYEICGDKLVSEMKQIKPPYLTQCVITNAYNLPCKKIIHVSTPKWNGGNNNEEEHLKKSYINCLEKLQEFELKYIAFPILCAGANNFSHKKAIEIATHTLSKYADKHEDLDISLVVYDTKTWNTYKNIFSNYSVIEGELSKTTKNFLDLMEMESERFGSSYKSGDEKLFYNGEKLKELNDKLELYRKAKKKSQFDLYNGVISKTAFHNILNGSKPDKYTLVALGINILLDRYEIDDLLIPIGERLNEYNKIDQIIIKNIQDIGDFIDGGNLIDHINKELNAIGAPPLKTNKQKAFD